MYKWFQIEQRTTTSLSPKHSCFVPVQGWIVRMFSNLYFKCFANERLTFKLWNSLIDFNTIAINWFNYNVQWSILSKRLVLTKWEYDWQNSIQLVNENCYQEKTISRELRNAAYLIWNRESFSKRVNHAQNLCVKNSKTQELKCISN